MFTRWSVSDTSDTERDEEELINLCLMAKGKEDEEKEKSKEHFE